MIAFFRTPHFLEMLVSRCQEPSAPCLPALPQVPQVPVMAVVLVQAMPCVILNSPSARDSWMWVKDDKPMIAKMCILEMCFPTCHVGGKKLSWALVRPMYRGSQSACPWCSRDACSHTNTCSRSNLSCRYCHLQVTGHCCMNLQDTKKLQALN